MNIDPFTGKKINKPTVYSDQYAVLLDEEEELDPELSKQLLLAIQKQHEINCLKTTAKIAATRTVYSRQLRKNIYATSWELFNLHTSEGRLPPPPIPTPTPTTPDTEIESDDGDSDEDSEEEDTDEEETRYYDTDEEEKSVERKEKRKKRKERRRRRKRSKQNKLQNKMEMNLASELSVLDWLKQRRQKVLPKLQQEAIEREEREREKLLMKRKKYKVLLPEEVRGSTANVLHVIRNAIRSFTNQGIKATRSLFGKKVNSPRDLFEAMDRDGDGELTYDEVRGALHRLGIDMSDLDFANFMNRVDTDKDGSVDVKELEDAVMNDGSTGSNDSSLNGEKDTRPEKLIWQRVFTYLKAKGVKPTTLFHDIDDDGSGIIGPNELRDGLLKFVGIELTDEEFQLALNVIDRDGSGEIEYNELSRAIKYGDPTRRDQGINGFDVNAEIIAKQMHGRYSLVQNAKKKKNQWDLTFDEIERGVVKVEPRKPTPLFNLKIEQERSYIEAMNVPRPPPQRKKMTTNSKGKGGRRIIDPTISIKDDNGSNVRRPETASSSTDTMSSKAEKRPRLLSEEEERHQQREKWINMSKVDRGGLTRKKYIFQQRLLALNPKTEHKNYKKFQDKKRYGRSNKDGRPKRGDPGGMLKKRKEIEKAKKIKMEATLALKEKGAKAKGRWGKLKFASKFLLGGTKVVVADDNETKVIVIEDTRPDVDGVKLDHPARVAAFVDGQKKAGKTRKQALAALRKLTPNAHATNKATAFFTASDALVARAGIMTEIKGDGDDDSNQRLSSSSNDDDLPDELRNMSTDQEAVVERALVSIARYIYDKRARVVDVFRSMDHDGGGTLDREELEWGLRKFGCQLKGSELDMVVSVFDSDGGGTIDFKEFAAAIKFAHRLLVKELHKQKETRLKEKKAKRDLIQAKLKIEKEEKRKKRELEKRNIRFQIADQKAKLKEKKLSKKL